MLVRGLTNTGLRRRTYVVPLRAGPVVVAGPLFISEEIVLKGLEAECDGLLGSNGVYRVWIDGGDDRRLGDDGIRADRGALPKAESAGDSVYGADAVDG
jgi:hypothetical protein